MSLLIDDPALEADANALAVASGQSVEEVVRAALMQAALHFRKPGPRKIDIEAIHRIQDRVAKLPVLQAGTDDELIGYNEFGVFD